MNKKVVRLGTAALLVASLSVGALVVGAQDATGSTTDSTTQAVPFGRGNGVLLIVAEQLGLEPAELMTELQAGKTIAQLAEENDVSLDTITEAIIADRQDALAQAVTDGRLTQAQADARLALLEADVAALYERTWEAPANVPGFGRGDGFGRPDGFGGPGEPSRGQRDGFGGPGRGQGGMWGNKPPQDAPASPDAEATVTPNA